jgi:hypothetical protein
VLLTFQRRWGDFHLSELSAVVANIGNDAFIDALIENTRHALMVGRA